MSEDLRRAKFAAPPERAAVARDWRARGYGCGTFVDPPGQRWEDFVHECNEPVTVVEGRLELEVAGAVMIVGPGDEVFTVIASRILGRRLPQTRDGYLRLND